MIAYGLAAYLAIAALTIGYFIAKKVGDARAGEGKEEYK